MRKELFFIGILSFFSVTIGNEISKHSLFYKECSRDSNLPFLQLEYLYWKTQNNGFISGTVVKGASTNSLKTKPLQPHFEWDSGFRTTFGWNLPYDFWSVFVGYTYFRTHVSTKFNAKSTEAILGYWTLTDQLAQSGASIWEFQENLIEFGLGKSYFLGPSYFIYPFIGGRYGWLDQDFGSNLFNTTPNLGYPSLFSATQTFHGGGPLIGVISDWLIGRNFSFLGKIAASLLYGTVKVKQNLREIINMDFETTTKVLNYTQNNQELLPSLQLLAGASWGKCLNKTVTMALSAAWEVNYWWNQYQLSLIQPSSGLFDDIFNQPVIQQGITAQASFYF